MTTPTAMIWPCLNYRAALGAIRFLVDVVGFDEAAVHTSDDGRHVQHAEPTWPEGGGIMLGSAKDDGTPFEQLPTPPSRSATGRHDRTRLADGGLGSVVAEPTGSDRRQLGGRAAHVP